jgi:hypothetical protein
LIATLLVTDRMSPELRARIEASVRGRRSTRGPSTVPLARALVRFTLVLTVLGLAVTLILARSRATAELEAERAALLAKIRSEAGTLTPGEMGITRRVEAWLSRSSGTYGGDTVAGELRAAGAFAATLRRPTVYVRGPVESFARSAGVAESASVSYSDAFVLCLLDPPGSRSEKALLGRARSALGGGERVARVAPHVARLHHAVLGLPLLTAGFEKRVQEARRAPEIALLRRELERAPLAGAKAAAKAELLLFAMDEPGDKSKPAELDGERPHYVRVGLVDLPAERLLLELRRHVDPSELSAAARAEYAMGIDSCTLALDVRAEVLGGASGRVD